MENTNNQISKQVNTKEQVAINIREKAVVVYSEEGKNDEVHAWVEKDYSYKKRCIVLSFVSKDNRESEEIQLLKSAVKNNKKALDFIYDLDIDLNADKAITAIRDYIENRSEELPRLETFEKSCFKDVYAGLCEYVHNVKPDLNSIFIKDGFCYIEVSLFKNLILKKFSGVSEREVKKWLLREGLLRTQNHGYTYRFRAKSKDVPMTAVVFKDNEEVK